MLVVAVASAIAEGDMGGPMGEEAALTDARDSAMTRAGFCELTNDTLDGWPMNERVPKISSSSSRICSGVCTCNDNFRARASSSSSDGIGRDTLEASDCPDLDVLRDRAFGGSRGGRSGGFVTDSADQGLGGTTGLEATPGEDDRLCDGKRSLCVLPRLGDGGPLPMPEPPPGWKNKDPKPWIESRFAARLDPGIKLDGTDGALLSLGG